MCALLFSQFSFHTLVGGGWVVFLGALLASGCWVSSLCLTPHPRLCWGRTRNLLQKSLSTHTSSHTAFPRGHTASSPWFSSSILLPSPRRRCEMRAHGDLAVLTVCSSFLAPGKGEGSSTQPVETKASSLLGLPHHVLILVNRLLSLPVKTGYRWQLRGNDRERINPG